MIYKEVDMWCITNVVDVARESEGEFVFSIVVDCGNWSETIALASTKAEAIEEAEYYFNTFFNEKDRETTGMKVYKHAVNDITYDEDDDLVDSAYRGTVWAL